MVVVKFCLLGCNAIMSFESQPEFWRNKSPPSSGLKNEPDNPRCLLSQRFLVGLFFIPGDGSSTYVINAGRLSVDCVVL